MKKAILTITILFFSSCVEAQNIKLPCADNVEVNATDKSDSITVFMNKEKFTLQIKENEFYQDCKISLSCVINELVATYTFQNGNEYRIVNCFFKKDKEDYKLDKYFIEYSSRNEYMFVGAFGDMISINQFDIFKNYFSNTAIDEKTISFITNLQDKEINYIPSFYKLIKKNTRIVKMKMSFYLPINL